MIEHNGMKEATVIINGRTLTFVESMTLRLAIGGFAMEMTEPSVLGDAGLAIAQDYLRHANAIRRTMMEGGTA